MQFKTIANKRTYNEAFGLIKDYEILNKLFPKKLKLGGEENLFVSNYSKNINYVSINNINLYMDIIKCLISKILIKYNFYYEKFLNLYVETKYKNKKKIV